MKRKLSRGKECYCLEIPSGIVVFGCGKEKYSTEIDHKATGVSTKDVSTNPREDMPCEWLGFATMAVRREGMRLIESKNISILTTTWSQQQETVYKLSIKEACNSKSDKVLKIECMPLRKRNVMWN